MSTPMQLFRFGDRGGELPGVVYQGRSLDVSKFGQDYDGRFFATDGPKRLAQWLTQEAPACPEVKVGSADVAQARPGERLGPPLCAPSKIVCVGLNYREHARETGATLPKEPKLFFKATSALAGPYDDLELPRGSTHTDWEVELAVIIGRTAKYVSIEAAMTHVAAFAVMNDYSERHFQKEREGQWMKGKSHDGFAPLGPYLVTPDAVDFRNLSLWLEVNGVRRQHSSTADMVFDVPTLVSYISEFMTLLPGDVISTGTPPGVGLGMKPPLFLAPGDMVRYGIDGLGEAAQHIVAPTQR